MLYYIIYTIRYPRYYILLDLLGHVPADDVADEVAHGAVASGVNRGRYLRRVV